MNIDKSVFIKTYICNYINIILTVYQQYQLLI